MYEIFLTGFILIIGIRAALSIPKHPRYSRVWVLRSLLLAGLYIVFSLCGMIVMVKLEALLFPPDLTEDQTGLIYIVGWILWMTSGTIGLIRMDKLSTPARKPPERRPQPSKSQIENRKSQIENRKSKIPLTSPLRGAYSLSPN